MTTITHGPIGTCADCGKLCFTSRKECRKWFKARLPSETFNSYRCGVYFHYGHKSYATIRGLAPRNDYRLKRKT